jgi:hypothetical protein
VNSTKPSKNKEMSAGINVIIASTGGAAPKNSFIIDAYKKTNPNVTRSIHEDGHGLQTFSFAMGIERKVDYKKVSNCHYYIKHIRPFLVLSPMEKKWIYMLLGALVLFNIIFTVPILKDGYPSGGDIVGHYDLVVNTIDVVKTLVSSGDLWLWNPDYYFGFPLFFYYAPLPYVLIALLSIITTIDPLLLFKLTMLLAYSLFPIVMYKAVRLMELDEQYAFFVAFFSTSLSSVTVFGLEYYAFFATGLFSQLFVLLLFPFAFAYSYRYLFLKKGKLFWPVLFLGMTFVSHFFVGLISGVVICLLALSCLLARSQEWKDIVKRTCYVAFGFFVVVSFLVVPYLLNGDYFGNITFDLENKQEGYGVVQVFQHLFEGTLLDYSGYGRFPVLTILFFIGIFVVLFWKRLKEYLVLRWFLFIALLFSLVCLSGRRSFAFFDWLPVLSGVQTFRFIFLFHFVSLFFIGAALYWIITLLSNNIVPRIPMKKGFIVVVVLMLISFPVFIERMHTMEEYSYAYDVTKDAWYWDTILAMQETTELDGRVYIPFSSGIVELPQHLQAIPILTRSGTFVSTGVGGHDSLMSYYGGIPVRYELLHLFDVDYIFGSENGEYKLYLADANDGLFSLVSVPFAADTNAVGARYIVVTWIYSDASVANFFVAIGGEDVDKGSDTIVFTDIVNDDTFMSVTEKNAAFDNKLYGQISYVDNSPQAIVDGNSVRVYDVLQDYARSHNDVACGTVETVSEERGKYVVRANVEAACSLLFKMSFHPEWNVFVDGSEQEMQQLSPAFMGVALDEGEHEVVFSYEVFWYRPVLFLLGIIALVVLYRRRD